MKNFSEFLIEKKNEFEKLKANKVSLTDDERAECFEKKAVWHFNNGKPSAAVWKSVDPETKKVTFVTNTHRAYNTASTLKGAIGRFHKFIKGTS
jgi:hypothetical protein